MFIVLNPTLGRAILQKKLKLPDGSIIRRGDNGVLSNNNLHWLVSSRKHICAYNSKETILSFNLVITEESRKVVLPQYEGNFADKELGVIEGSLCVIRILCVIRVSLCYFESLRLRACRSLGDERMRGWRVLD